MPLKPDASCGGARVIYVFENCSLDTHCRELRRNGSLVPIEPQAFELLEFLIRNRTRVVSKDDLIAKVWGGRIVSESTLSSRITNVRQAIGDSGEAQRLIRTVSRKGVRFIGLVQELGRAEAFRPDGVDVRPQFQIEGAFAAPEGSRISIVVLPFSYLSSEREHEYFADAVVEDITTDLSRLSETFVIARSTAMTYKGRLVSAQDVGRELKVRYILEGSVQRLGNRVRVNSQLIDVESGGHLWADKFDGDISDLLALSEGVSLCVGRALSVNLIRAASRRAQRLEAPDAVDLILRGRAALNRRITRENYAEARLLFTEALKIAPNAVGALAGLGTAGAVDYGNFCVPPEESELLAAAEAALDRALDVEPNHALARYGRAMANTILRRLEPARDDALAAIELDPTFTPAYIRLAQIESSRGDPKAALLWTRQAMRISPREPRIGSALYAEAHAHTLLGNDEEAVMLSRRAIGAGFKTYFPYTYLAAALANLGHIDEARSVVAELTAKYPSISIARLFANRRSDYPDYLTRWQRYLDGLRKAGLPEA
jgi:TolB-like protein/tetratricopeptide (TPR) repeat protein